MNLLSVDGLTKSYARGFIPRREPVLKGLSFTVPAGQVTGFLGANGAGKTTTMRCILGLDFPDSGTVEMFGKPADVAARAKVGFLPERPYFYEHLTGVEFLEFYGKLSRPWARGELQPRITALLQRVDLEFAKDRALRTYSKGMLQKIGVAQSLIHSPELIILDEPMSGLDPDGRLALAEIIRETAAAGTAVFFTSHLLHDTERLCERLIVIKDGRGIYEGTTQALLERSGTHFEITFADANGRTRVTAPDQAALQIELRALLDRGARVIEVRQDRPSLEEVFVAMALRKDKTA